MGFWIFMFIITLLIPTALLLTWYSCPKLKKINKAHGYRTKRSMKNRDTWAFAQKYCARVSIYMFFPSLLLSLIVMPTVIDKSMTKIGWIGLIITTIQMMSFVVIMISTEKALRNNFDKR